MSSAGDQIARVKARALAPCIESSQCQVGPQGPTGAIDVSGSTSATSNVLIYNPATGSVEYNTTNTFITSINSIVDLSCSDLINTGDIIPCGTTRTLGSALHPFADMYVGNASLHVGTTATIGATGGNLLITGSLIPSANLVYSIGTTLNRWESIYLGINTLSLGGYASISADLAGVAYTQNGFATPSIVVGPEIIPGTTGIVGGWRIQPEGIQTSASYDLVARQNVSTFPFGLTGPTYSLIKGVVRNITAGPQVAVTSGPSGTTIGLQSIAGVSGPHAYPSNVNVNSYGQITSITNGRANPTYGIESKKCGNTPALSSDIAGPAILSKSVNALAGYDLVITAHIIGIQVKPDDTLHARVGIFEPESGSEVYSEESCFTNLLENGPSHASVIRNYPVTATGIYTVNVYAWAEGGGLLGDTHLLVLSNMTPADTHPSDFFL